MGQLLNNSALRPALHRSCNDRGGNARSRSESSMSIFGAGLTICAEPVVAESVGVGVAVGVAVGVGEGVGVGVADGLEAL